MITLYKKCNDLKKITKCCTHCRCVRQRRVHSVNGTLCEVIRCVARRRQLAHKGSLLLCLVGASVHQPTPRHSSVGPRSEATVDRPPTQLYPRLNGECVIGGLEFFVFESSRSQKNLVALNPVSGAMHTGTRARVNSRYSRWTIQRVITAHTL